MHTEIIGRSPQQIVDDEHVATSTYLAHLLNLMSCGCCLYTGSRRARIIALRDRVDGFILGEQPPVDLLGYRVLYAIR